MNTNKALVLGLAATLLLALGLVRLAERLDPVMNGTTPKSTETQAASPADMPCIEPNSPANVA
jgi:hypothetical protein